MSYTLHVATTYKVEYGGALEFNHMQEQIYRLLNRKITFWANESHDTMEIDRVELLEVADHVEKMSDKMFERIGFKEDSRYTQEFVANLLRKYAEDADPDDNIVHLSWY
jgi:hypothetical protein